MYKRSWVHAFAVAVLLVVTPAYAEEIPLERQFGHIGTYTVTASIAGIDDAQSHPFLVDTGASYVKIPHSWGMKLLDAGAEFVDTKIATFADGSQRESKVLIIPELRVGPLVVRHVLANFDQSDSLPLLGQSFLSLFGIAAIDYKRNVLILGQTQRMALSQR